MLSEETVLPPCPVNTILPNPVPPPSDIDLVLHATQLAAWLQDDQNSEVSEPITSFSGSHLRPTPRPGSACSRLETGAELEGWRYHLHQGQPELGMKCQSTAAQLDLLSLNSQTLTAGTSPGFQAPASTLWAKLAGAMANEPMEMGRVVMPHCDVSGGSHLGAIAPKTVLQMGTSWA